MVSFFERRGIGVMTDRGHHGEGEHDQRYVPMPAMPGAALIVIEAEFVLGGLEAVFDGPATAFHRDQFFRGHQVEKNAIAPSAMLRRISKPRVHCPVSVLLYCATSRSASSR